MFHQGGPEAAAFSAIFNEHQGQAPKQPSGREFIIPNKAQQEKIDSYLTTLVLERRIHPSLIQEAFTHRIVEEKQYGVSTLASSWAPLILQRLVERFSR